MSIQYAQLQLLAKTNAEALKRDEQAAYKQRKAAKKAYNDSLLEYKLHTDDKKTKVGKPYKIMKNFFCNSR